MLLTQLLHMQQAAVRPVCQDLLHCMLQVVLQLQLLLQQCHLAIMQQCQLQHNLQAPRESCGIGDEHCLI